MAELNDQKLAALALFQSKNFTKQQLEMMISLTLVEGGLSLDQIRGISDDWANIIRLNKEFHDQEHKHLESDGMDQAQFRGYMRDKKEKKYGKSKNLTI